MTTTTMSPVKKISTTTTKRRDVGEVGAVEYAIAADDEYDGGGDDADCGSDYGQWCRYYIRGPANDCHDDYGCDCGGDSDCDYDGGGAPTTATSTNSTTRVALAVVVVVS